MAIVGHLVIYIVFAHQTLNHSDIEPSDRFVFASSYLSDILGLQSEEERKLGNPLIE